MQIEKPLKFLGDNNAAKAIEFYKRAFGATEVMRFEGPGGSVAHAEIEVGGSRVMLGDRKRADGTRSRSRCSRSR